MLVCLFFGLKYIVGLNSRLPWRSQWNPADPGWHGYYQKREKKCQQKVNGSHFILFMYLFHWSEIVIFIRCFIDTNYNAFVYI